MKTHPKTPSQRTRAITTPPRSAPVTSSRGRYSASRLEQLAVPRPSSSWKKPIKNKFQRRSTQPSCRSSWKEVAVSTNKRLSMGQQELDIDLERLHGKIENSSQRWRAYDINQEDWNDCYSSSADSDCNISEYSLRKRVHELSQALSIKDHTIQELESVILKKDALIGTLQSELQLLQATENEVRAVEESLQLESAEKKKSLSPFNQDFGKRLSIDSIDREESFNAYFMKVSSQLDSKLSDIDKMRLDHDAKIEIIHDTSHCSLDSSAMDINDSPSPNSNIICQNDKEAVMRVQQIEMLMTSLATIKEEQHILKHEFRTEMDEFNTALNQNSEKIMAYVQEELQTEYLPAKELQSYNQALQYELQITQLENSELRAETEHLRKAQDCSSCVTSSTPCKKVDPVIILSPIPTLESWNDFCMRFKNSLIGNDGSELTVPKKKKVLLDYNATQKADRFFEELAFTKDTTPFRRHKTGHEDTFS